MTETPAAFAWGLGPGSVAPSLVPGGHHLTPVQEYAATHRIRFYWTPTDASWLNRIEAHFTALRKFTLTNTDYRSHEEQQEAMESYLRWRNGERPLEILDWETYCWEAKKTG